MLFCLSCFLACSVGLATGDTLRSPAPLRYGVKPYCGIFKLNFKSSDFEATSGSVSAPWGVLRWEQTVQEWLARRCSAKDQPRIGSEAFAIQPGL